MNLIFYKKIKKITITLIIACVLFLCRKNVFSYNIKSTTSYANVIKSTSSNSFVCHKAYITFDDGPGDFTDEFLDLFDKYNVKVTYFFTYDSKTRRDRIKKIYDRGHAMAVHSYKHKPEIIYLNEVAYFTDLAKILTVVKDVTGVDTHFVRFPFGSSNTISKFNPGIMTRLAKLLGEYGYKYFDWNVYGNDANGEDMEPQIIFDEIVKQIEKIGDKQNLTILCHDTHKHTLEYMKLLIPYLIDNDYKILPITDVTYPCHHRINN